MKFRVQVSDSGPLSFRTGREPSNADTLTYVPGSALLGGLASAHARLRKDHRDEFRSLFLSDGASYGNLYPFSSVLTALEGTMSPVYPLPVTARSCKRFGGFAADEEDPRHKPHHGVRDALVPWALFMLSGETKPQSLDAVAACHCGEPMDHFEGFYRRDPYDPSVAGQAKIQLGLRSRTGINRATGTAEQRVLYSRQVLRAGTKFWGTLTVPDAQADSFHGFVEEANSIGLLRLGNNRTRGFGRVTLYLEKVADTDAPGDVRQRVERFDALLRAEGRRWGIATPHRAYVPLVLLSDAIVYDHLLRCRRTLTPEYLEEAWGLHGAEVIYRSVGTRRIMGWSELWGLPKADAVAMALGSVFLLGFPEPLSDETIGALVQMQDEGIGARRREGFGRVQVASPFHWEVEGDDAADTTDGADTAGSTAG